MALYLPTEIRRTIDKHRMFEPRDRLLAGVSGGADSICLALALRELGCDVTIAHVNHGLRGAESDGDEAFTADFAGRFGFPYFTTRVQLPAGNIEAAGRAARKAFFTELARRHGFAKIALAHTRDDRIETFLLNLFRGAGAAGLTAMPPVTSPIVRPLIESRRQDIEEYLRQSHQEWRTDASNFDLDFTRNRLRHALIPQLEAQFNVNLRETLGRTIDILEQEDAWQRRLTEQWLEEFAIENEGELRMSACELLAAPVALARRVIRRALERSGSELRDVSFDRIEAVRTLLEEGKSGKTVQIPGGSQAAREFDQIVLRKLPQAQPGYEYELQIPGSVHIPELDAVFRAEVVASEASQTSDQRVFVDADSIGPCVKIRNWQPGDYYRPVGLPAGKLKKLFQRARIPRSHRTSWPVVVADSTIIWAASFPVSREFAPRGRSQKIVAIEALKVERAPNCLAPESKVSEP